MEIDVSGVTSVQELHSKLAKGLSFPEFYGHNWDAFWDAITGLVELPRRVVIVGWGHVMRNWPRDAGIVEGCLSDLKNDWPGILCEWELRG